MMPSDVESGMDIGGFQREVARLMEGIEHPRVGVALALGEECGEVLRSVLEGEVYGSDVGDALAEEVGDVLLALAEICERFGLRLDTCAECAVEKLEEKAPGWRARLGERLQAVRERMDT